MLLLAAWVERFPFASVSGGSLQSSAVLMVDYMNQCTPKQRELLSMLGTADLNSDSTHSKPAGTGCTVEGGHILCDNACQLWKKKFFENIKFLRFSNINPSIDLLVHY